MSSELSTAADGIFNLSMLMHIFIGGAMLTEIDLLHFRQKPAWDFNLMPFSPYAASTKPEEQMNIFERRLQFMYQQIYLYFFVLYIGLYIFRITAF